MLFAYTVFAVTVGGGGDGDGADDDDDWQPLQTTSGDRDRGCGSGDSDGGGGVVAATVVDEVAAAAAAKVFIRRFSATAEPLCCRLLCVVRLFLVRYRRRQNSHTYRVSDRSCLSWKCLFSE